MLIPYVQDDAGSRKGEVLIPSDKDAACRVSLSDINIAFCRVKLTDNITDCAYVRFHMW